MTLVWKYFSLLVKVFTSYHTWYIVYIAWNFDKPYWVVDIYAYDANYQSVLAIIQFLLLQFFNLIPGFLKTCRTIVYSGISCLSNLMPLKDIVLKNFK